MMITIKLVDSSYLENSAHERGVSRTGLVKMVMDVVLKDQMILSILDDADELNKTPEPPARVKPQRVFSRIAPPAYVRPSRATTSRAEMRAQLTQAVVNTGGKRITLVDRQKMVIEKLASAGTPLSMAELGGQLFWAATDYLVAHGQVHRILDASSVGRSASVRYSLQPPESTVVAPSCDGDALSTEAAPAAGDVDA